MTRYFSYSSLKGLVNDPAREHERHNPDYNIEDIAPLVINEYATRLEGNGAQSNVMVYSNTIDDERIQPASIDLTIEGPVFTTGRSLSPVNRVVESDEAISNYRSIKLKPKYTSPYGECFILRKGNTYLAKIDQVISMDENVGDIEFSPRSTTARNGIDTRIIAEGKGYYDYIEALGKKQKGYTRLYIEITPLICDIMIRSGQSLSQMRVALPTRLGGKEYISKQELTVDVDSILKSKEEVTEILDLEKKYDKDKFWEPVKNKEWLVPGKVYLINSIEVVNINDDQCGLLTRYNPKFGNLLSHMAGFFDPGFSNVATLEVTVNRRTQLFHHQPIAELIKYGLNQPATQIYGSDRLYNISGSPVSKNFHA